MIEIKLDLSEVYALADDLAVAHDQVPFAMARVMNAAAFIARDSLVHQTWPRSVEQRAINFPSAVIHVVKATKSHLHVEIVEDRQSSTAPLIDHAEGGTRHAKTKFAIPLPDYRRGRITATHGLKMDARLAAVLKRTPKRALRITPGGVFIGQHGRLQMIFAFKEQVTMRKDVPFEEDFKRVVMEVIDRELEPALLMAMRTRFT